MMISQVHCNLFQNVNCDKTNSAGTEYRKVSLYSIPGMKDPSYSLPRGGNGLISCCCVQKGQGGLFISYFFVNSGFMCEMDNVV